MEENSSWSKFINIPTILAAAGALMVFGGSFLKMVEFSAFNYTFPVYLKDLRIDDLVMMLRIVTVIAAVLLFIPKVPPISYAACTLLLMVLFVPKAYSAYNIYIQAQNILDAFGVSNFIDLGSFMHLQIGYRLLFIGFLIMAGCSIYFIVKFFAPKREGYNS